MIRKGKRVLLPLVLLMSASTAFGLAACGGNEEPEAVKYTVTYERGADDATGAIPASASYAEGDSFKLLAADTFSREGYTFECWNDGTNSYAAGADYTMPAKDVSFKAIWELEYVPLPDNILTLESVPQSELRTTVSSATANWFAEYQQDAFVITVYVEDAKVYTNGSVYENDSVGILLDKAQRVKGYTEDTVSVVADAAGNVRVTSPYNDGAVIEDTQITASVLPYTLAGEKVEGYKAVITVPYSEVTFTQAEKNASVALGLTNSSGVLDVQGGYETKYGTDEERVHTYICVTDDNTFAQNPDVQYGRVWGDAGKLKTSSSWNIDEDDGSASAHVYMTGNDFADNYAYMHSSNANQMYAEVKLSVKEVMEKKGGGYDDLPKFGITITTADGKTGLFFWVGADCNGDTIKSNSIKLGHVTRANGGWATWTDNIGNLGGTSAQYQGDEYVTLGIYRQGGVLKLYANGVAIKTVACGIKDSDEAYIGLASFNLKLDAKDYKVTTNKSEFPAGAEITQENRDYVFLGDSYIDTAFWYNYENQFKNLSAANMGVGGTKVGYWTDMTEIVKTMYNPGKILFHIGVNDIDDGNTTGEETIERLKTMFAAYKEAFPDTEIYYVTIEHNMMFTRKWAEYDKVNAWVKTLDDIRVIDMASLITKDAAGSTQHWFNSDGLHYGVDGYALFNREICEAFGIARTENAGGLGDVTVTGAPAFAYSAGWVETDGVWHNAGNSYNRVGAESQLFISDAYATDFYAEVEISVASCYANDDFPKTGIALRSATGTYFYALDCQKGANNGGTNYTNNWGNLWYRGEYLGRDWTNERWSSYQFFYDNGYDYTHGQNFKKLAVAKLGTDLWFLADDKVVNFYPDAYGADEKVAAAVLTFNMEAYARNASAITDAAALKAKLDSFKIYENDGMRADGSMDDWTEEQKSNPVVIPATDGRSVTIYATKGADGIYLFYDVIHSKFKNDAHGWWRNTNLEFKFNDGKQYFADAAGLNSRWEVGTRTVNASRFSTVEEGGKYHTKAEVFVSYACIDVADKDDAVIPMGFAWKTGGEKWNDEADGGKGAWVDDTGELGNAWAPGDYWYGPEADPNYTTKLVLVTDNGIKTGTERTIDGDLTDWASDTFTENTNGTRYAARLANDGLYIALEVKAPSINVNGTQTWHYTDNEGHWDSDWWKNTNIEFFGEGTHNTGRVMCFEGKLYHTGWITDAEMKYTHGDTEDTLVFEVFIANEHLKNVTSETESVTIDIGGQLWWINEEGNDQNAWKDYARKVTVNRK